MGIIDYLREYTIDKGLEHYYKLAVKAGKVPTIVDEEKYKKRF